MAEQRDVQALAETLPEVLQRLTDCVRDAAPHRSGYAQSRDIQALAAVRAVLTQQEAALKAAEGVLYALPKSALSKRRAEVLKQVRAALSGVRSDG